MAYEQSSQYQQPSRGYYAQQAPRGAPRPGPRGPPRGAQAYADPYNGYGQEGVAQHYPQHDGYEGYDRDSFWDQYGGETAGYDQQYQQADYGREPQNYQGYNNPPQHRRPPPQQHPREHMQRREDYPSRGRGYANGPGGPMGPPQGGRGRGPPRNYPTQNYGPSRGGMQQYDDRRQMGGPQADSPPRQKQRLLPVQSPQATNFDNPFPMFPSGQMKPKTDAQIAEQAMSGLDLNGRPSQESRRPPTSGSGNSGSSRSNQSRPPGDLRGERPPRSAEDRYGPRPPFENRGPPARAMTMPQDIEYPANNRRFNQEQNPWPETNYDAGYGPGRRDPIQDRSNTTLGERPIAAMQAPPRPSTATGMRQQPNMAPRNDFTGDLGGRPAFSPAFAQNIPPRPGTSQGYHGVPAPAPLQASRPPIKSKESELEAWMPDFDSQPLNLEPLHDPIGLPLDAAPEALTTTAKAPTADGSFSQQVHKTRSQPDVRGQANGYAYGNPADAPMVPRVPPNMAGPYAGQPRDGLSSLNTNGARSFNTGMANGGSMPNSPRQFHRPGAPPIMRNETAQSGRSDPGPGVGSPISGPGPRQNGLPNGFTPNSVNPDALPAHPTPVRPGLMAGGAAPGPAQIRQAQAQRQSNDSPRTSQEKRMSMPVTIEEINRLREAVRVNPADQKQALFLAQKLVEAARVLANEGGRADERATQKNREKYIFEAHKHIKRLVSGNYVEAMFYLADCYGTGQLGLAVDPKEAFGLYQAAAKLGHGPSAYRTAVCCEMGLEAGGGTRKDALKAVQWYKRAAALGDTPAMYKLGMILLKGLLGQQASLGEAMIWLQRAAEKADEENPHALHELAQIYESAPNGGKVIRDEGYALQLYQQAAKLGYRNSQARLGKAYEYGHLGCQIDNRSSIHWYSKAAAQEDHDAELALSGWYLTGSQGILAASDQEAYLWARKAALAELPKAEFAMGYFSETGIGCPKSLEDAKRWYGRAAAHKYPKAQQRLEELIRGGGKNLKNRERMSRGDEKKHEDCIVM